MSDPTDPATDAAPQGEVVDVRDLSAAMQLLMIKIAIAQHSADDPDHPALDRCARIVKVCELGSYGAFIAVLLAALALGGRVGVAFGVLWGIAAMVVTATVASTAAFLGVQRFELARLRAILAELERDLGVPAGPLTTPRDASR